VVVVGAHLVVGAESVGAFGAVDGDTAVAVVACAPLVAGSAGPPAADAVA